MKAKTNLTLPKIGNLAPPRHSTLGMAHGLLKRAGVRVKLLEMVQAAAVDLWEPGKEGQNKCFVGTAPNSMFMDTWEAP